MASMRHGFGAARARICAEVVVGRRGDRGPVRAPAADLPPCSSGFGADDFNTVRTQLVTEFGDVSTVEKLMAQLQKPLVADAATVEANLTDITQAIDDTINPPNLQTQGNPEALISSFFYIGSAIPGPPGALFSLDGATMGLAAQMTDNSDGSNEMAQNSPRRRTASATSWPSATRTPTRTSTASPTSW